MGSGWAGGVSTGLWRAVRRGEGITIGVEGSLDAALLQLTHEWDCPRKNSGALGKGAEVLILWSKD